MLPTIWKKLSSIGIKPDYDEKLKKRYVLVNQFNFISIIVYIVSSLNDFLNSDTKAGIIDSTLTLIAFSGFLLNSAHKISLSVVVLFINTLFATFFFDSYFGFEAGNYLYYFPLLLGVAYVIDFEKDRLHALFYFTLIIACLLTNILTRYSLFENPMVNANERHTLFILNSFFSSITVAFIAYLTIKNNLIQSKRYEEQINKQHESEIHIQQALKEKEVLLSELHHRVKNNMAIISGLFNFAIENTKSEEAKLVLNDSKNRVHSMALIHNKLYKSKNLTSIDFTDYTKSLVDEIKNSYPNSNENVVVKLNFIEISLSINQAIPCGLIINEVLTNCFKHAFVGRKNGTIELLLEKKNSSLHLIIKDDGVGIKENYRNTDSVGIQVVESLTEQLEGTHTYEKNNGTQFELVFEIDSINS